MPTVAETRDQLRAIILGVVPASIWGAQAVVALATGHGGLAILTNAHPEVTDSLGRWVLARSPSNLHGLGIFDLAMAFGVVAPSLVRIAPKVATVAALGIAALRILGAVLLGLQGDALGLPIDLTLAVLALFVVWGRLSKAPIQPHAHIRC